jgi:hypothetical protein
MQGLPTINGLNIASFYPKIEAEYTFKNTSVKNNFDKFNLNNLLITQIKYFIAVFIHYIISSIQQI